MKHYIIALAAVALVLSGCHRDAGEHTEETTVITTSPVRQDTTVYREYVSQIRAIQHIELRALEKGYVQKIYVDEGQSVKKGQLLFQIKPVIYQAEVQKAQADVSFAEIEYQNTKRLADSNIVSKNELALAKAKLDKEKSELALASAHLGFTEIRAPFNGIVGRFNDVRLGSLVDEGDLLTTLSDNSTMWVYFNVPEAEYLDYMKTGKSGAASNVKLRIANNTVFDHDGEIETIEADFNNETGNIAFRAAFKNPNTMLRNGETGNILMPVALKNALLIPQKATFEIMDKKYVYVVDSAGVVQAREISTGTEMPHIYQVTGGIGEQDKIITDGLRKVKNGQKVLCEFRDMKTILSELGTLHAE
ncbi:MAG: efflux RND transporter periplasmic adaptor subunit [Candidatus Kapabacteria bacterium]|nr:efflux RND transporter periplasmic adaptor subunit [Candidatus Kapabacteria bacterium]